MKILNLTQHLATPDQVKAGVVDLEDRKNLTDLLTFTGLPDQTEVSNRAICLANLAADQAAKHGTHHVMIGGAPYLMAPLERELDDRSLVPLYAFSLRESVETVDEHGRVIKRNVFIHAGFVPGLID